MKDDLLRQQNDHQRQINKLSLLRLVFFLSFLASLIAGYVDQNKTSLLCSLCFLLAFIITALRQASIYSDLKIIQNKLSLIEKIELKKQGGFGDIGNPSQKYDYCFYDLDVFGNQSLMRLLTFNDDPTICKALEYRLTHPKKDIEEIEAIQKALMELNETKLNLAFLSQEYGHQSTFNQSQAISPRLSWLIKMYPLFSLIILLIKGNVQSLVLLLLLGWLMAMLFQIQYRDALEKAKSNTKNAANIFALTNWMISQSFECDYLNQYQEALKHHSIKYKQQNQLYEAFQLSEHMLLSVILNGLLFFNGWLYLWYLKVEKECRDLPFIFDDFAALCEMSLYLEIYPEAIFPKHSQNIDFKDLKHPLMTKCIGNDFTINEGCVVITGSNMSGKTTFMRTIGLSLLMYYYGLPVRASFFQAPLLKVYTSMRVIDDLSEGISSFYGELERIKTMIACAKKKIPAIYFIDEIFKGTNFSDRMIGAKKALETLNYPNAFVFLSTHDLELCHHDTIKIHNYHFNESYQNNRIYFDYTIKEGICKTTNARYLMKMIGLLEEEKND